MIDADAIYARAQRENKEICTDIVMINSRVVRDQDHANRSFTIAVTLEESMERLIQ